MCVETDDVEDVLADVDTDGCKHLCAEVARHGLLLLMWRETSLQANPPFRGSSRSIPLADAGGLRVLGVT